jgi:hypothetical protein
MWQGRRRHASTMQGSKRLLQPVPDHYTLLGIAQSATTNEIKAAYRRLIAQFHPDLNPDPQASEITALLNAAYAVLMDAEKRKHYDAELKSARAMEDEGQRARRRAESGPPMPTHCRACGRQDSTLRFSQFSYVLSFVLMTRRLKAQGVWCERCRLREAAKWTLVSGFVGWWAIPWGPVETIRALAINRRGGRQPAHANAVLLRNLGFKFYGQLKDQEAIRALEESLNFMPEATANALLDRLQPHTERAAIPSHPPSLWTRALAVPVWGLAVMWVCLVAGALMRFGGYRSQRPAASSLALQAHAASPAQAFQQAVGAEVTQLTTLIASRSDRVGSHYDGSTLVVDYNLDRSRFDASELYPIAHSIGAESVPQAADARSFWASAYFNAMLFALSVDMVNRVYAGLPIQTQAAMAWKLGADPRISAWLRGSKFKRAYQALESALHEDLRRYKPGQSIAHLETKAESIQSGLEQLEYEQDRFQAKGDIASYNRLVPVYNRQLGRLKSLSGQIHAQLGVANQLDLAFNRCLDSSILFPNFEQFHITSAATKAAALK